MTVNDYYFEAYVTLKVCFDICYLSCILVQCGNLSSPSSGSVSLSTDGITTVGYFKCDENYYMVGENSSTCKSSGDWTSSLPSCCKYDFHHF
jgi:pectate lyase